MALFETRADRALDRLLDQERAAILAQDFDRLAKIIPEKERILTLVAQQGLHGPLASSLRSKAERNAALLVSASKGIKAASARLAQLRAGPAPLSTYGPEGARLSMGKTPLTMERKA